MPTSRETRSLFAGVLAANSAPHLASAVAAREQLTPLAGRDSSPRVNAVWGAANLAGGLVLLRRTSRAATPARWDSTLHWFELGAAAFATWRVAAERAMHFSTAEPGAGSAAPSRLSRSVKVRSLVAGLLVGNSAPHLATAAAGRLHMTPLAGRDSSPQVNAVWGTANLIGGLALLRSATRTPPSRQWDARLLWYGAGVAIFAAWMAGSEVIWRVNSAPS